MSSCNCSGKRGKNQLDLVRLAAVKKATFRMWPLKDETEKNAWLDCTKSIDEACRRHNRPKKV